MLRLRLSGIDSIQVYTVLLRDVSEKQRNYVGKQCMYNQHLSLRAMYVSNLNLRFASIVVSEKVKL